MAFRSSAKAVVPFRWARPLRATNMAQTIDPLKTASTPATTRQARAGADRGDVRDSPGWMRPTGANQPQSAPTDPRLVSPHRSHVLGCPPPSERRARARAPTPARAVLTSDAPPGAAPMARAARQIMGDATPGSIHTRSQNANCGFQDDFSPCRGLFGARVGSSGLGTGLTLYGCRQAHCR